MIVMFATYSQHSYASEFESNTFTVELETSGGTNLPGGTLKYYDGSWHTATESPTGTWSITTNAATVTLKMYYNNGIQQVGGHATSGNYKFTTTTTTVALRNSVPSDLAGGTFKHYQNGWSGSNPANTSVELLPGNHTFKMYYNNGIQQMSGVAIAGPSQEVLFETTTTTVALKDSGGTLLGGGTFKHYQNGWSSSINANTSVELLPGNHTFKMYYNNGIKQMSGIAISGTAQEVVFTTTTTTVALEDSDMNALGGGTFKHYQNGWSGSINANTSVELLPGNHTFKMYYNNGIQQMSGIAISGTSQIVLFETVTVTPALKDCASIALGGGTVKHYQNGWSSSYAANTSTELLPGNYTFKMYFNNGIEQQSGVAILDANDAQEVLFTATQVNLTFAGTVKHYQNGWGTYYYGKYLLPGNYTFKFGTFQISLAISGCEYGGNVHVFKTLKADGSPLPNIRIRRNDYGNHFVLVGYTDANGCLFTLDQPDGSWKFRADKNYSYLDITGSPGTFTFQTAKFIAHVKHTDGSDFAGIEVEYNDYGNHWIDLDPQQTDANGNSSIELFPGDFNFRAKKNYSVQVKSLEILTSGTSDVVTFQTAKFIAHVKHTDGSDFEGIEVEYNDYGNHWIDLAPKYTDVNGNSSIELFPGNFTFRAKKNYSYQSKNLEITTSGSMATVEFQTATAKALVKDCDTDSPISGIEVEYNDYGNHWIDLAPKYTDVNGNSLIELFPGAFTLRAKTIYTYSTEPITLVNSGDIETVEFNPTRVCFNYAGTVKYNDYGNHWINLPCNTYMFSGTYDFRFDGDEQTISISECVFEKTLAIIKLIDSNGDGILGQEGFYKLGGTYHSAGLTDSEGEIWAFMDGSITSTYFRMKYLGHTQTKLQNVSVNPVVLFQTVAVTVEMRNSSNALLTAEELLYKHGDGTYHSLGTNTEDETIEMLPLSYYFRAKYLGHTQTLLRNVTTTNPVVFQTEAVTVEMRNSGNALIAAEELLYKHGDGTYHSLGTNTEDETIEMLPLSYYFRAKYLGHTQTLLRNVTTTNPVVFQTEAVTVEMRNSGNALLAAEELLYKHGDGTYHSLGMNTTDETIEMLPLSYYFRAKYLGHTQTLLRNVTTTNPVVFQTVAVTVELQDSEGDPLVAEELLYKHGDGTYHSLGTNTTDETIEMLPLSYYFRASYSAVVKTKLQNVGNDPNVVFTWDGSVLSRLAGDEDGYKIENNYPNPFDRFTTINYSIPEDRKVSLMIYDWNGKLVKVLVEWNSKTSGDLPGRMGCARRIRKSRSWRNVLLSLSNQEHWMKRRSMIRVH